jgi:hypothetical protein
MFRDSVGDYSLRIARDAPDDAMRCVMRSVPGAVATGSLSWPLDRRVIETRSLPLPVLTSLRLGKSLHKIFQQVERDS